MKPSLFGLFKRGRYYRSTFVRRGDESERSRSEKERFITAALAFCFTYDKENFGQHFFRNICQRDGDPALQSGHCRVTLEDQNFDLVLENRTPDGVYVYVIEAKVGASLQENQNPGFHDFWTEANCYGAKMLERFSGKEKVRYIIVGSDVDVRCAGRTPVALRGRFELVQKQWSDLAVDIPADGMCGDVTDLLTRLGIEAFMLRQTNDLRPTGSVQPGVDAYLILSDVCALFGLQPKYRAMDVQQRNGDEPWFFGLTLKRVIYRGDNLRNQKKLTELVRPAGDHDVCWLGYEEGERRSVWFYCGTAVARKRIQKMLAAKDIEGLSHPGSDYVFAVMPKNWKRADRDWFASVLSAAGMKKAKV